MPPTRPSSGKDEDGNRRRGADKEFDEACAEIEKNFVEWVDFLGPENESDIFGEMLATQDDLTDEVDKVLKNEAVYKGSQVPLGHGSLHSEEDRPWDGNHHHGRQGHPHRGIRSGAGKPQAPGLGGVNPQRRA